MAEKKPVKKKTLCKIKRCKRKADIKTGLCQKCRDKFKDAGGWVWCLNEL